MMELDEAIKHCEDKAKELSDKAYSQWSKNMTEEQAYDCNECAREHEQLAEWLTDYKRLKALEEQERPTGEWIIKAEDYYKAINERGGGVDENTPYFVDDIACPKCLTKFSTIDNETERFNCCPNCGAKMEEADDDRYAGEAQDAER